MASKSCPADDMTREDVDTDKIGGPGEELIVRKKINRKTETLQLIIVESIGVDIL